jgi:hypothetical protein
MGGNVIISIEPMFNITDIFQTPHLVLWGFSNGIMFCIQIGNGLVNTQKICQYLT